MRRTVAGVLLALIAVGATVIAADASARVGHACCQPPSAPSDGAPVAPPCAGFLPLTCCSASALPGGGHSSVQPPLTTALGSATHWVLEPPSLPARESAALVSRASPTRFSVVLQL